MKRICNTTLLTPYIILRLSFLVSVFLRSRAGNEYDHKSRTYLRLLGCLWVRRGKCGLAYVSCTAPAGGQSSRAWQIAIVRRRPPHSPPPPSGLAGRRRRAGDARCYDLMISVAARCGRAFPALFANLHLVSCISHLTRKKDSATIPGSVLTV